MTELTTPDKSLYDRDLALWFADRIGKLRAGNFERIDVANLIEELESLAGCISQK